MYVGLSTVYGFVWWYLWYSGGPKLSWKALSHFQKCDPAAATSAGFTCDVFTDKHPKTISMTVLVIVEMFNALNNISENSSLAVIPFWDNGWLLAAITVSVALHCLIMYVPALALLFGITHLSWAEWWCVLLLSAPVILVDEGMKWLSRRGGFSAGAAGRGHAGMLGLRHSGSVGQLSVPLVSIQVTSPLLDEAADKRH
eukprot:GHRQ01028834.1.p2 GENE.GHRQ01028834.1~~GHRQ01028834.1.p2  ORF type:complete len:199 (-),score=61.34 GHRQ01028834.1:453-1049(-)